MKEQKSHLFIVPEEKCKEGKDKEMAGSPVNLSQVSGHVHYFSKKCYSLRYWKPLIVFLLFYNYIVKMLQINNQNYTLKFTRAKDYITHCTFMQLE